MRALIIDPARQTVSEADLDMSLRSLQEAVGGNIEVAHEFPNGDVLYVNEEGLSRAEDALEGKDDPERAFWFDIDAHQPFAGRGIVVGPEGSAGRHGPAKTTLEDLFSVLKILAPRAFSPPPGSSLQ